MKTIIHKTFSTGLGKEEYLIALMNKISFKETERKTTGGYMSDERIQITFSGLESDYNENYYIKVNAKDIPGYSYYYSLRAPDGWYLNSDEEFKKRHDEQKKEFEILSFYFLSMKDLKVKDLDPVLQNLFCSADLNSLAHPLLSEVDWSKCTKKERLKYAELMYPVGTKCKSLFKDDPNAYFTTKVAPYLYDYGIAGKKDKGVLYYGGEFAEIISRPEDREETKEPEFQPGRFQC